MVPDPITHSLRILEPKPNEFNHIEPPDIEPSIIPHKNDILFGKGTAINAHPGNKWFRSVVNSFKPKFVQTQRELKRSVAAEVIDEIRTSGRRFLVEVPNASTSSFLSSREEQNDDDNWIHPTILLKVWACAENSVVTAKVMHRLREKSKNHEGQRQAACTSNSKKGGSNIKKKQATVGSQLDTNSVQQKPEQQAKAEEHAFSKASPKTSGLTFGCDYSNELETLETSGSQVDDNMAENKISFIPNESNLNELDSLGTLDDLYELETLETSGSQEDDVTEKEISFILNESNLNELDSLENLDSFFDNLPEIEEDEAAAAEQHEHEQPGVQHKSVNVGKSDTNLSDTAHNLHEESIAFQNAATVNLVSDGLGEELDSATVNLVSNGLGEELDSYYLGKSDTNLSDTAHDLQEESIAFQNAATANLVSDGLGEELDSYYQHDTPADPAIIEGTMLTWIERFKSKFDGDSLGYVKAALPVALRLAECIIEADKEEKNGEANPIPLASINAANVLIRTSIVDSPTADGQTEEAIDYLSILSCMGDEAATGDCMQRLVAIGLVLYTLFTGEDPPFDEAQSIKLLSLTSINLNNDNENSHRPKKMSQRNQNTFSECMFKLKCSRIPCSMVALIWNLLDCSHGDLRSHQAYSCIQDVLTDLQLMLSNPSTFLHDIETNPLPPLRIPDKIFGREFEIDKLERLYRASCCRPESSQAQASAPNRANPLIITGKPGVGKSKLAMHVQELTKSNGYFIGAKFDQNSDDRPLATLGNLFNTLCDLFARDATEAQLKIVNDSLESALGAQASLLLGMLPSLPKILPSCQGLSHSSCVNLSISMQFLLSEVLRVISSHCSKHITFLIDDLQWADQLSLLLIGSLVMSNEESKRVFFTCTYRDDEVEGNEPLEKWLSSMSLLSMETIELDNMSTQGVNTLLSEALHTSPRITRPLSSVLHHKAGGGSPLFLMQLLVSLEKKQYIYVDLSSRRWSWDLDRISDLAISDNVVSLLIEEMKRLNSDQQLGLTIASCLGTVKNSVLDILSKDIGQNMREILEQEAAQGFLKQVNGSFCFTHDKIRQAAYQLLPTEQQRRENHMRYGLALCAHTLSTDFVDDEIFFTAVNQINRGGKDALSDSVQRDMIATLNLKAGKRSAELSDMSTAFSHFLHGISFLGSDHWQSNYELSIDLFDSTSYTACVLNNSAAVTQYTEELVSNARTSEDKFNCMLSCAKSLFLQEGFPQGAVEASFKLLLMLGEDLPRPLDDQLYSEMNRINALLSDTTDETLLAIPETDEKRLVTSMKVYNLLGHAFHFIERQLLAATGLRMVALTLEFGICVTSPLAFAYWGEFLVSIGNYDLGCRLGRVALKLSEKRGLSTHQAQVLGIVHQLTLWISSPLQSIAEAHTRGLKAGQQCGDVDSTWLNHMYLLLTNCITGESLVDLRKNCRDAAMKGLQSNVGYAFAICILHVQCCALTEGLHMLAARHIDNIPGVEETLGKKGMAKALAMPHAVHRVFLKFLFRDFGDMTSNTGMITNLISGENKISPRPTIVFGIFFEGLIFFQYARQTTGQESYGWMKKGEYVLENMKCWADQCQWNFENKRLILEAELMSILGERDKAESLYIDSIKSARNHRFIHEEALASELAGLFFYETGLCKKALSLLAHAFECYKKWGALAVAKRVETDVQSKFGSDLTHLGHMDEVLASIIFTPTEASSKRRQGQDDC